MKVLPISTCKYSSNFNGNKINNSQKAAHRITNNVLQNRSIRKSTLGIMTAMGLSALALLGACKKDDPIKTVNTENKDIVDFAFRDFVNIFNLDTVGPTKVLKQAYVLNSGDSLVENFNYPTTSDTLYADGIYYYNGPDSFIDNEQPFQSIWTKTQFDGQDAVKVEYKYPYENRSGEMPEPQEVYYIPGNAGDNTMKMIVKPGTGNFVADVNVAENTATYKVEDKVISNPFSVKIEENY